MAKLKVKDDHGLPSSRVVDNIGIISINDSFRNNVLVSTFDKSLDDLFDTKGLIVDLRNTVDSGNSYLARGIMGRFISQENPTKNIGPANNTAIILRW